MNEKAANTSHGWRCAVCHNAVPNEATPCSVCAPPLERVVAEMRRLGVTRYKTSELEIDLGPAPAEKPPPPKEDEPEVSEETKQEREWVALFKRATRASGAPIPPFPRRGPKIVGQP